MYTGDSERQVIPAPLVTFVVLLFLPGDAGRTQSWWPP
jgi:hypothetical protein